MPVIWVFVLVAIVSFAVVMLFTRPSLEQKLVRHRLEGITIEVGPAQKPADLLKRITYSDIPALDALFRRFSLTQYLQELITQANSKWTVGRLVSATALIFAVVAWLGSIVLPSLALRLILAVGLSVVPYFIVRFQRDVRFKKFDVVLPDAVDLMSRGLRAGHSVSAVIEMVGQEIPSPVGPEFRKVFEQQNFGMPFREAMEDLARRVPISDLLFVVTAILVQKESGGNLAEVLDKAGVVVRERVRLKGELAIYTAQGRITGWILGLLPFVMFVLIGLVNPNYTQVLIHDPLGQKLVITGLVLMAVGFYIIRRIVDIKV